MVVFNFCGIVDPFENMIQIMCMWFWGFFVVFSPLILFLEVCRSPETRGLKGSMIEKPNQMLVGMDNRLNKGSRNKNTSS